MTRAQADTTDIPETGAEQRQRQAGNNRLVALLLVGVALVFLLGALGVAALVLYGPY